MNKRILISGAKGFIGNHLTKALHSSEYDLITIDIKDGIDITNWNQIASIKNIDIIIHLAAKSYVPKSYEDPRSFYETNIIGTLNLLELARKNNSKFIYTSSYIYGKPDYLPIDENHPVKAFNPYSQSKIIGEELCKSYNRDFKVPIIIFRPFNIYGPGQADNFIIPHIIKQIPSGRVFVDNLNPKRDFIYIDDLIDALLKGIEYKINELTIFNLGSAISYSVNEIIEAIMKIINKDIIIVERKKSRAIEIPNTVANYDNAKNILNWVPKISFKKGLELLLNW